MRILVVTPASPRSTLGNRVTAVRWQKILRQLGHRVSISQSFQKQPCELLIALHARRSHASIVRFRQAYPNRPIILALTGTDLYRDIRINLDARQSLKMADRIVVLQPLALRELARSERKKTRVIYQSVEISKRELKPGSSRGSFDVCLVGHLRAVKDPFRAALAARLLPNESRIRILQIGSALTKQMERRAKREAKINPRFEWLGEVSRARTFRELARSQVCVISSRMEGGANVLSEAIVASLPVLASRIAGNIAILGDDYPGLFDVGATRQLKQLMQRLESDPAFRGELSKRTRTLARLFNPRREEQSWAELLKELI